MMQSVLKRCVMVFAFFMVVFAMVFASGLLVHASGSTVIIDNEAAVKSGGTWTVGTSLINKYGANYYYISADKGAGAGHYLTYRPYLETAGTYNVYYWVPAGYSTRSIQARYTVVYNTGSLLCYVDQKNAVGGRWELLGTFDFDAGTSGYVTISNKLEATDPATHINADAIKFEYTGASDDFETGNASEWTSRTGSNVWSVTTDTNRPSGEQKVYTNVKNANSIATLGNTNEKAVEGEALVAFVDTNAAADAGVLLMYQDGDNFYHFRIDKDTGRTTLYRRKAGTLNLLGSSTNTITVNNGVYYRIRAVLTPTPTGYTFTGYVNDNLFLTYNETTANALSFGGFGLRSNNCSASYDNVKYSTLYNTPANLSGPLRGYTDQSVSYTLCDSIQNNKYKIDFYQATWDSGSTVVRDVFYNNSGTWVPINTQAERLEEQWVVLSGINGDPMNYYASLKKNWTTFDGYNKIDNQTIELTDSSYSSNFTLTVRWHLSTNPGSNPKATITLTPAISDNYIVGYQALLAEPSDLSTINEVLCGIRLKAKMTGTVESMGLYQLSAPMSLFEKNYGNDAYTVGIYTPGSSYVNEFESGSAKRVSGQRYGMSLKNNENQVQPVLYAPQWGTYSNMTAGTPYTFEICNYAAKSEVFEAYRSILRGSFGYSNYRKNVYGSSLTDAMFNIIDLIKTEPVGDDSVDYVKSQSGWWSRAKGFVDIENDQSVRNAASGVLLSAYYLTGDNDLYDNRALPTIQFALSRNNYGWTPKKGYAVYDDPTTWKMSSVPFDDATTVASLYDLTRKMNAGIYQTAMEVYPVRDEAKTNRGNVINPLMMYRMTGDVSYLNTAKSNADTYITSYIDTPRTTDVEWGGLFLYSYARLWTEILELYEETKDAKYLDAAYKEAKRYITQIIARPVPSGTTSVASNVVYGVADRWYTYPGGKVSYNYPRTYIPEDTGNGGTAVNAENWIISINGMTYEQGVTSSSYRMNFAEAPFLYRIGMYKNDDLFKDIAHNMVIGRFANYPGYYYKEYMVSHLKDDYPYLGPTTSNSIYYHHIPSLLGYAMDYLISENVARSNQSITFPAEFEANYVWFKYRMFGAKPGSFYGNNNVWLWMPKGIISTNNYQINWITAESGDKFYISLTNESDVLENVTVNLNNSIVPFNATHSIQIIKDNGTPQSATMTNGVISTTVSAKGITAIIVNGMNIDVALHEVNATEDTTDKSYFFDRYGPVPGLKAMLLVKPDRSGYDAYIQSTSESECTLYYSTNGGATYTAETDNIYPIEWSIRVNDVTLPFKYYVVMDGKQTAVKTLYLPNEVITPPDADPAIAQDPKNIVIDNADIASSDRESTWYGKTVLNDYYNDGYFYASLPSSYRRMRWRPTITTAGNYKVYYWIPNGDSTCPTNASYTIYYSGGNQTFTVNQQAEGGRWIQFGSGSFPFAAGTNGYVELRSNGANGSRLIADAVKFELVTTSLLSDGFEDGNYTSNPTWTVINGSWSVVTDGTKVLKQSSTSGEGVITAGNTSWTNYTLQADVKLYSNTGAPSTTALLARYTDSTHYYMFRFDSTNQKIQLYRRSGGSYILIQEKAFPVNVNVSYKLKLILNGTSLKGYVNNQLYIDATDSNYSTGSIGVRTTSQSASVDNVEVW